MGLFDRLKRLTGRTPPPLPNGGKSRVDFLLDLRRDHLEKRESAYGGGTFIELVEQQLREGQTDLATWNIASQVRYCFEIANLHWGQGDLAQAELWLRKTVERHERLVAACRDHGVRRRDYREIDCAKCAALLLGVELAAFVPGAPFEPCYEPWFKNRLLDYCLGTDDFDMAEWQAAEDAWTKKRHPKFRLDEFNLYAKALTGQFASTDAMLQAHATMFARRATRNFESDMLDGFHDNELVVDFIFAAILKRIGWEGTYRHSWPNTAPVGSAPVTTRQPDAYLGIVAAPAPAPDPDTGIIEDEQEARRFIDLHVAAQVDDGGTPFDATRPASDKGKVAAALKSMEWRASSATLDLMRTYRMDRILNDRTHVFLCDPLGSGSSSFDGWTKLFSDDFGLHPDFIAVTASEEKTDWLDPQGRWYVYRRKDRKVYAVDRDEWDRPDVAIRGARAGLTVWPSYVSFVAWWVGQHLGAADVASTAHRVSDE